MIKIAVNVSHKLRNALKAPQADDLARNLAEEAFYQVEPGTGSRSEVQMEAFSAGQPGFDLVMFVSGVIVADDVDLFVGGHRSIDLFQKGQPFIVPVPFGCMSENLAAEIVQRGKERHCPVAVVIVGACADMALPERQSGLRAFECLTLALFVATKHHSVLRRVEIKTDHIPILLLKFQIVGEIV